MQFVQPVHDSLQGSVPHRCLSENQRESNGQLHAAHWPLDETFVQIAQALFYNLNKTRDNRLL